MLKQLRTLSLGDFMTSTAMKKGLEAMEIFVGIYLDVIRSRAGEETRETAVRFLFDFLNLILAKSDGQIERNRTLFPGLIEP